LYFAIHRLCRRAELISAVLMPNAGRLCAARSVFISFNTALAAVVSAVVAASAGLPTTMAAVPTVAATRTALSSRRDLAGIAPRRNIHTPLTRCRHTKQAL
jgi:hypothetical protein